MKIFPLPDNSLYKWHKIDPRVNKKQQLIKARRPWWAWPGKHGGKWKLEHLGLGKCMRSTWNIFFVFFRENMCTMLASFWEKDYGLFLNHLFTYSDMTQHAQMGSCSEPSWCAAVLRLVHRFKFDHQISLNPTLNQSHDSFISPPGVNCLLI